MKKIENSFINFLLEHNIITNEEVPIYRYGFIVTIQLSLCLLSCLVISFLLEMLIGSFIFWGIFSLLRSYTGGIHLKKYWKCYLLSVFVHTLVLVFSKKNIMDLTVAATLIIIICGILFLIRPINHPNRTVSYEEDRAFHKMKNRNIILVFVFSLCLYFAHMEEYLSLISYTLIAILLSALAGENMQKLFLG